MWARAFGLIVVVGAVLAVWSGVSVAAARPPAPKPPVWRESCPATPEVAALERSMFDMVNRARQDSEYSAETGGAAPMLWWNARLADVARCHSEEMMERGYFAHRDLEGLDPGSRLTRAGLNWTRAAENIALAGTVVQAESLLMNEPPFRENHRGNILNPHFQRIGIGIARNPSGRLYVTQDFMEP